MKVCPKDFYTENYFFPNTKNWVDEFGVTREYIGPAKDWHGFSEIASYLKESFPKVKTIFDIGCSAGSFIARSRAIGFDSVGCDISRYAVNNCVEGARTHVRLQDITKDTPWRPSDMVVALDLMEHIYEHDLDKAIQFIMNSAKPGGRFVFCIATARSSNELWQHTSEEDPVPNDKTWLAVAGHVNIKKLSTWIERFEKNNMKTDYEAMFKFQMWRRQSTQMNQVLSWDIENIYIGTKQ